MRRRIRKPLFAPVYIARTWESTFHCLQPIPAAVVAAGPVVAGWLDQVTPSSVQLPVTRTACSVRPLAAETAKRRSVAVTSSHPYGAAGSGKRTRERAFRRA
jgi:hypothetical protein